MSKTFYHLSHIDLDGYSCQLVMAQTAHIMISFNANYGAEVTERLEEIIELIKKIKVLEKKNKDTHDLYDKIVDLNN
jgi:oligoribonuclease NrnB/cAMP/cGMP phosphodiesterase (DHH superfamily)